MRPTACGLAIALCMVATAGAGPAPPRYPSPLSFAPFRIVDPAEEVALARSAAPPSISGDAEILTLGRQGYETAVKGANGFVCLVDRSWSKPFDDPEFWNPAIRAPECLNAAASRSVLPIVEERARWVMAGVPKAEILKRTRAALAAKTLPTPAPGSMVYMMSKQGYIADGAAPHWHSHVMFYLPLTPAAAWGANLPGVPVFHADDDVIGITTFFVLAPKWSDGSSAVMEMK
ncbi:MAG: hypothetical protein ABI376_02435 [Caulobacteraceae bacterium]